ncbi:asparaginase [Georgenia halophila]|uniref:asparaginase n=1 Tax=Georgenia halophila TaxID=620889 RepID=A0ABP8LNG3_9MICO
MPGLTLLATGGTIAARSRDGVRNTSDGVPGADVLDRARAVWGFEGEVDVRDVAGVGSSALTVPDVLALVEAARAALTRSDGVVITHGTDTMEETAFLLSLALGPAPVAVTGSQRAFDDSAPDGPRNLAAALAWASDRAAADAGVTVVFADLVLPAIGVHKSATLAPEAFTAPGRGPIGHVDESGVRRHAVPPVPGPLLEPGTTDLPRVALVPQYLGADEAEIDAAVASGAQGLVVATFGSGNTTPAVTSALVRLLDRGFPVVMSSRTGSGAVSGLYTGGGADLIAAGAVPAGDLSPWQARLLLAAALAPDRSDHDWATRMRRWLADAGAGPRS